MYLPVGEQLDNGLEVFHGHHGKETDCIRQYPQKLLVYSMIMVYNATKFYVLRGIIVMARRYEYSKQRTFWSLFPLTVGVLWWGMLMWSVFAISMVIVSPALLPIAPGIVLGVAITILSLTAVYLGYMSICMMLGTKPSKDEPQSPTKLASLSKHEPQSPTKLASLFTAHKWQVLTYLAMLGTGLLLVGLCVGAMYVPFLMGPIVGVLFTVGIAMGIHGMGVMVFTAFFAFGVGALVGLMGSATMYFAHIPLAAHYRYEDEQTLLTDPSYFKILREELGYAWHGVTHSAPVSAVGEGLGIVGTLFTSCANVACDHDGASFEDMGFRPVPTLNTGAGGLE